MGQGIFDYSFFLFSFFFRGRLFLGESIACICGFAYTPQEDKEKEEKEIKDMKSNNCSAFDGEWVFDFHFILVFLCNARFLWFAFFWLGLFEHRLKLDWTDMRRHFPFVNLMTFAALQLFRRCDSFLIFRI